MIVNDIACADTVCDTSKTTVNTNENVQLIT